VDGGGGGAGGASGGGARVRGVEGVASMSEVGNGEGGRALRGRKSPGSLRGGMVSVELDCLRVKVATA